MKKYSLEIIVFCSGAVVMALEVIGSRILAPYVGTSLPVWTSIIGILLASLSFGYWWGGKLADRNPSPQLLSTILLSTAGVLCLLALCNTTVLSLINGFHMPITLAALLSSIILLVIPSILLGIISPYVVRIKLQEIKTAGAEVGRLSALGTMGSITGTFLSGFVLLRYLGSYKIMLCLALVMVFLSLLAAKPNGYRRLLTILITLAALSLITAQTQISMVADIDTAYSRATIKDKGSIRTLYIGGVTNSAMDLSDPDKLVYDYSKVYGVGSHFQPHITSALVLGGGGYSYPKALLKQFPKATVDVVEIDPEITRLAKTYFAVPDDARLGIYDADGRTFLNTVTKKYDAIYGDAYGNYYSVPYQLTTREAIRHAYDSLNDDGVFVANIISSLEGDTSTFFRAEYKTIRSIFPQVYVFPVRSSDPTTIQNIIVVGIKSTKPASFTDKNPEINGYLANRWLKPIADDVPILTDDFAPVDQYISALLK